MFHDVTLVLFATTTGFTASGIVANVYRLMVTKTESPAGRVAYVVVMIAAGPTVLFDHAARAWRGKACSGTAFWLAAAICGYWSLALGLFVIQLALAV